MKAGPAGVLPEARGTGASASPIDVTAIRRDFPILAQQVNGHPLAYLDNAASSQRPLQVLDAMRHYDTHDHANIHRGVHTLSHRATDLYEGARTVDRLHARNHRGDQPGGIQLWSAPDAR